MQDVWQKYCAHIAKVYGGEQVGNSQFRLNVTVSARAGLPSQWPVMLWLGRSALTGREVAHCAAPVLDAQARPCHTGDLPLAQLALEADSLPAGSLREYDSIIHLHEVVDISSLEVAVPLGHFEHLIRFIAEGAASLSSYAADVSEKGTSASAATPAQPGTPLNSSEVAS